MIRRFTPSIDLSALKLIDRACDDFESRWKRGERPRIEDYLGNEAEETAGALVETLLALDVEYRQAKGEVVTADDYTARFPQYRQIVDDILQAATRANSADPTMSSPARTLPAEFAHFQLLDVLGHGATGTVYRAFDPRLERMVAVKIAHQETISHSAERIRFAQEAQNAARLDHPGIVRVLEVGTAEGHPFIVSELIDGPTLATVMPGSLAEVNGRCAVQLVVQMLDALQHAHDMAIVHRDLKPSNVLLSRLRSTEQHSHDLSACLPRITDFGHSRRVDRESDLTATGAILGTPAYMSPEQAAGSAKTADVRSDVYSMGVILYQLLAGRLPFTGSAVQVISQIACTDPPSLSSLNPRIPADLVAVCHRCLERDPLKRYPTAADLRDDLLAWLDGRATRTRPEVWRKRVQRRMRASKGRWIAALLLICFLLAGAYGAYLSQDAQGRLQAAERITSLLESSAQGIASSLERVHERATATIPQIEARLPDPNLHDRERLLLQIAMLKSHPAYAKEVVLGATELDWSELPYLLAELTECESVWQSLGSASDFQEPAQQFCVAAVWGNRNVASPLDDALIREVVEHFLAQDADDFSVSLELLRSAVRSEFIVDCLFKAFHSEGSPTVRTNAARALANYLTEEHTQFVELIRDADAEQFASIVDVVPVSRFSAAANKLAAEYQSLDLLEGDDRTRNRRRSNLAVALLLSANVSASEPIWQDLGSMDDPETRYALIWDLPQKLLSPDAFVLRLLGGDEETTTDDRTQLRYALLVMLGSYESKQVNPEVLTWARNAFLTSPSPAVHNAAEWFLRQHDDQNWLSKQIRILSCRGYRLDRDWYYTPQGHCMIVVRGPVRFTRQIKHKSGATQRQTCIIPKTFAISAKLVTVAEFQRFSDDVQLGWESERDRGAPAAAFYVEATAYSNWLSDSEGIWIDNWAYPPDPLTRGNWHTEYGERFTGFGYRIQTEAEYEYLCQAGLGFRHAFGNSDYALTGYCWGKENENNIQKSVAQLRPNAFGAFDLYGNAGQWCHELYESLQNETFLDSDDFLRSYENRTVRGSFFGDPLKTILSTDRFGVVPISGPRNTGVRLAQTIAYHDVSNLMRGADE